MMKIAGRDLAPFAWVFFRNLFFKQTGSFALALTAMLLLFCHPLFGQAKGVPATEFSAPSTRAQGVLYITSSPSGLPVYVDTTLVGYTPLLKSLAAGRYPVLIPAPDRTDWHTRDWQAMLTLNADDTTRVQVAFMASLTIRSQPSEAIVLLDSLYRGVTPLTVGALTLGPHTLRLTRAGYIPYQAVVVADTLKPPLLEVTLQSQGHTLPPVPVKQPGAGLQWRRKTWAYASAGAGVVFAVVSLIVREQADKSYAAYQHAATPAQIDKLYHQAQRRDRLAGAFLVASQLGFAVSFYFFLF